MLLSFKLDRSAKRALYQQIADQIKAAISGGGLPIGARLPAVRQLAIQQGVTRLTVQNAYAELQSDGWVEATVGRGTFVAKSVPRAAWSVADAQPLTPDTVISDILQINQGAGVHSMASASPDPRLFPAAEFWAALSALQSQAEMLATYASSQGDPQLRIELASLAADRGVQATPDEILVTAGVTQGLALTAQAMARAGDVVLVEQPTYLGFLHTLKSQGLTPVGVPMDSGGPLLEEVERLAVQRRPRFFYTVPSFQNPTGICLAQARRRGLIELAARHGFLIVEDDIYGQIAYDAPPPMALKADDEQGYVIYISSLSKVLMPGLRLGFVVAPPPLHDRLLSLRRANDLCSPPILQRCAAAFLADGGLKRHLHRVLPTYCTRRDAMLSALARHMPANVSWSQPAGGFCCWLTLPSHHLLSRLHQEAMEMGWAIAPGEVFLAEPDGHHHLRLCYGSLEPETIHNGIEQLAGLIRSQLARSSPREQAASEWTPLV